MWLFTKHGFTSIVNLNGIIFARFRTKTDATNFIKMFNPTHLELRVTEDSDYRYRIILNKGQLLWLMCKLSNGIDYPNFKEEIGNRPDQKDKEDAYFNVWWQMLGLQRREQRLTKKKPRDIVGAC